MSSKIIYISSATIWGLEQPYYFLHRKNCWCWDLTLKNPPSNISFNNNCKLNLGYTGSETTKNFSTIKKFFKDKGITDGSLVCIIYDKKGIMAIGKNGEDCWLTVRGEFKEKTFSELGILNAAVFISTN